MIDITVNLLILFFFLGLFAGFFDSISGGGGLLTIPVMLMRQITFAHDTAQDGDRVKPDLNDREKLTRLFMNTEYPDGFGVAFLR